MNTDKIISDFVTALAEAGYESRSTIIPDNKFHRLFFLNEKHSSGRYSLEITADGFAVAYFGSEKDPDGFRGWHSKSTKKMTRAERTEINKQLANSKKKRDAEELRRHERFAKYFRKIWNNLPSVESHPYLEKKYIGAHGIRCRQKGNELIIPIYQTDGKLWGLQRITESGWKGFVRGSLVKGGYFPLATRQDDLSTLILAEGYSTGTSVREATALPVIVCFNAGNMPPVAVDLKQKYPNSKFCFAADNDTESKNGNTGIIKAQEAAMAVGGAHVVWPELPDNKKCDWNDFSTRYGSEAVRDRILGAIAQRLEQDAHNVLVGGSNPSRPTNEIPETELAPSGEEPPSSDPQSSGGGDSYNNTRLGDFGMQYRVLGYDNGMYYYFPFALRQIVALSAGGHTMNNLFQIDTLDAWANKFGGEKNAISQAVMYGSNAMMQLAKQRGVFKQEDRVRGCGAWMDEGRMILNCGDSLYVNGERRKFDELQSDYTYIAAARLLTPADTPLDNKSAYALRKICEYPTWENPLSGSLLAGWLVVAQICAALEYRPHVYITGESQSGKSAVLNKIVKKVIGRYALSVGGKTTAPGVREQMGYDARPLIFDEAEPSANIKDVIDLARMASTGEIDKKFGQNPFNARFCACFSAIDPPISKTADESRHSLLVLKKNRKSTAMTEYNELLAMIKETITPDFGSRLIARTLKNIDSLFSNIETFQKAFRTITGDARASEQIGTMLAGLYLLGRTGMISEEDAIKWVRQYHWTDHTIIDQETDPIRLLHRISSSLIRYVNGSEISIAELISLTHKDKDSKADTILRTYGICVKQETVSIASRSHNLQRLLRGTNWEEKWSRTLADVPGAIKIASEYFSKGIKTSAVRLPISLFLEEEIKELEIQEELEWVEEVC